MPATGEKKKGLNAAARERERKVREAMEEARKLDAESGGKRYKSETLSYEKLYLIYIGQDYKEVDDDEEDGEEDGEDEGDTEVKKKPKKKVKKYKNPNPSKSLILGMTRSFVEWLQLRDQARKDLFWLGKEVLKHDFLPHVHQIVCDQFVQKNFDGVYFEGYTLKDVHEAVARQQRFDLAGIPTRDVLVLDPRGFYKSTISRVDCVQWMLNVPDVRILLITGEFVLATAMMKMVKGYLYLSKGEEPTDFHLLFPDYVLRGSILTKSEFVVPARKHVQLEPTLWVRSIVSNLAGWHCDIKKGDDVVTEKNCKTEEAREELNKIYSGTSYIRDGWGFSDTIGTRYFGPPVPDWYGLKLQQAEQSSESALKVFVRSAWVVKPEYQDVALKDLTEAMVTLNFPEKAPFSLLRQELLENEKVFRCQRLNNPLGSYEDSSFKQHFTEDVLRKHTYGSDAAPKVGDVYICWDWALTAEKHSDYSAGAVGRVHMKDNGEYGLSILEVAYGKWDQPELALQILLLEKKYRPKKTLIEASLGSEFLRAYLQGMFKKYGMAMPDFKWQPPSHESNAKRNRIKGLATLVKEERLYFVAGHWIDQLYEQFSRYTGEPKNRGRKEDIVDAISYFHHFLPRFPNLSEREKAELEDSEKIQKNQEKLRQQYDRYFGSSHDGPKFNPNGGPENPDDSGWKPKWPTKK